MCPWIMLIPDNANRSCWRYQLMMLYNIQMHIHNHMSRYTNMWKYLLLCFWLRVWHDWNSAYIAQTSATHIDTQCDPAFGCFSFKPAPFVTKCAINTRTRFCNLDHAALLFTLTRNYLFTVYWTYAAHIGHKGRNVTTPTPGKYIRVCRGGRQ